LGAVAALILAWSACGDVYRPVAIPVSPNPPTGAAAHFIYFLSTNGANNISGSGLNDPGSSTRIDVSGDTNVGVAQVGLSPVHATLLPNGGTLYVANEAEDTLSYYAPSSSTAVSTISLPAGSQPAFVASQDNTKVYAADSGTNNVAVISTSTHIVTDLVPVGTDPVALVETPDATKVYAVNQGDGTVTRINTLDDSTLTIPTGSTPVLAAARSDSEHVYILNSGSGTVSDIDTSSDTVTSTISVGSGANFLFYDSGRNRLYVTNPSTNTLSIISVVSDPPVLLATVPMPASPVSVTALLDGTRVYVASDLISGGTAASQVTVLNASNYTVSSTIPLASVPAVCTANTRFRMDTAASADSTRVYVSNCDAGSTAVISTVISTAKGDPHPPDTLILSITAPFSALASSTPGAAPPPQNPVFLVAGP